MKRLLAALLLAAAPAAADSYKGLTLGQPLPDTMQPVASQPFGAGLGADLLPEAMRDLCQHEFPALGRGRLTATSLGCHGPVLNVMLLGAVRSFDTPGDTMKPHLPTDIAGLALTETTLPEAATLFGSRGLIGSQFGQSAANPMDMFVLAYGVQGSDTTLILTFQTPFALSSLGQTPDPVSETDARLVAVERVSPDYLALLLDGATLTESPGYTPVALP